MTYNPDLLDNIIPPPGTTYKSSNKFHKGLSVLGLLTGVSIAIVIGLLYGAISMVNPIIYINFLLLIFAVLGIVFTGTLSKRIGKSRNLTVDLITVFIIGFVGWYSSWVFFYADQKSVAYFDAWLRFGDVLEYALNYSAFHRMSVGRFSSGIPMPSEVMFLFYVIEFVAFLVPVYMARKVHLTSYFCEGCNTSNSAVTYYGERNKAYENAYLALAKGDASYFAEAQLEPKFETIRNNQFSGEFATLNDIQAQKAKPLLRATDPVGAYRLEFSNCKKCKNNPIIDLYNGIIKVNDKDEVEFAGESDLVRATYIDDKGVQAIVKGALKNK
ncbi:MAG TPA: hypothetical protein VK177_17055 [Flavobacteriales bacterium]|nr:hypothetical protein [Flavobacteriales bacterium]